MRQHSIVRTCSLIMACFIINSLVSGCSSTPKRLEAYERWWDNAVFYEIFIRSFADSTTGPLANDGVGDIQGIIEKLDYLNDGDPSTNHDLGVTGIWLMPHMATPSYHGYDIEDYYAVEDDYGTIDDFKRLVQEAHKRGIRVIVDLVLNHTSVQHELFDKGDDIGDPYRDWFVWNPAPENLKGLWGQTVWHPWDDSYYYGFFGSPLPDWNFTNPDVTEEMYNVTKFWLEETGIDGFRLDAIRYLIEEEIEKYDSPSTHKWLEDYQTFTKQLRPYNYNVGEVWAETATTATYPQSEMDATFQFELAEEILQAVNIGLKLKLPEVLEEIHEKIVGYQYATFLTNHDQVRAMTILGDHVPRAKLAASILLTIPGTPFLYYGEEVGKLGRKPDPELRTPMQWSPDRFAGFSSVPPWNSIGYDHSLSNVEVQQRDPESLFNWYRTLIALRGENSCLRQGDYEELKVKDKKIFAFSRRSSDQNCLVVINMNKKPISDYSLSKTDHMLFTAERLHGAQLTGSVNKPMAELAAQSAYVLEYIVKE